MSPWLLYLCRPAQDSLLADDNQNLRDSAHSDNELDLTAPMIRKEAFSVLRFEMKGLDKLQRRLRDLRRNAQALDGTHEIPFSEIFPPSFIKRNAGLEDLEALFEASGFEIESQEDFEKIPDDEWDKFIREQTRFGGWQEMLDAAAKEWAQRKLGFR